MCLGIPWARGRAGRGLRQPARPGGCRGRVAAGQHGPARRGQFGLLDEDSVEPGDWVLIHMGLALERVNEEKATQARQGLDLMGRGVDQQ